MISIVLFTYDRFEYAVMVMNAIADHLITPEPIRFHIADDGSPREQQEELYAMADLMWGNDVSFTNSERRGYGGSYNLATQQVHLHSEYILCLEDDWVLTRDFDLAPVLEMLQHPRIDCVRLGYLGTSQPLRGEVAHVAGQSVLLLDPDSPEPHIFAGHPRLETRDFQRRIGPWPEGLPAGQTEWLVCHRPESRQGVAWPMDVLRSTGDLFVHIGTIPSESPEVRGDVPIQG